MTTTYTTTIKALYTLNTPNPNYVVNCLFTVSGTDGVYTAHIDGNVQFNQESNDPNFIPYSSLTENIVLGWINAATDNQANYYANIDGQIQSMITPPVSPTSQALPW